LLEHRPDALRDTVITMRNDDDDDDGEEEKLTSCRIHCVMTYVSAVLLSSLSNNSYCHVTSLERHSVGVVFHRVCLSVCPSHSSITKVYVIVVTVEQQCPPYAQRDDAATNDTTKDARNTAQHTQNMAQFVQQPTRYTLIMVALWNRANHYIFMLWFVLLLLSSFFPRLISAAANWMSAILPQMVWT